MPFNWGDYLNLARFLQHHTDSSFTQEAAFRSLVSRAYYAAYNHALNHATTRYSFTRTYQASDHRRLREHYRRRGDVTTVSILDELRQWRNKCDYNERTPTRVITAMIRPAISKAEHLLRTLV